MDTRLVLTLALIFTPMVAAVLFALYAFSANELLELAQAEVDERLAQLEAALGVDDPGSRPTQLAVLGEELARDGGGFRVRDAGGGTLFANGSIPDEGGAPEGRWLAAVRLRAGDALRGERRLASGETLEVAIGSGGFVRERDEIQHGFWLSLGLGSVLVMLGAVPATRRALAPLRRATRAVRRVDTDHLAERLPVRGTRDDVDRHAEAVNQLLERLEAGFGRIHRFSHEVAHELRTPVNRILNVAEIALLDADRSGPARAELESIREAAGHLSRTIDGLLMLARSESGSLPARADRLDVGRLCGLLEEMYGPACEEQGLRLVVECPLQGEVRADAALLLRAVGNLIDNAMTHSPRGGVIRLRAHREDATPTDRWVAIEVEDAGAGIPLAERERVFERFVRLAPDADGRGGSGLGLAIARGLVRAHGGEIEIRDSPGGGARFVARLPSADAGLAGAG